MDLPPSGSHEQYKIGSMSETTNGGWAIWWQLKKNQNWYFYVLKKETKILGVDNVEQYCFEIRCILGYTKNNKSDKFSSFENVYTVHHT
jgi:hypothetical protein